MGRLTPIAAPGEFVIEPLRLQTPKAPEKSKLEKALGSLVAVLAILSFMFQWKQIPLLPIILGSTALLVAASVFSPSVLGYVRSAKIKTQRNRFVRSQAPEFRQLVRRFAKFADPKDGTNLWNVIYYGCSTKGDESDFNRLCTADYFKSVFPLFTERLDRMSLQNEAEFVDAVKEFHTLAASYNQNYVIEPLKRMNTKQWLDANSSEGLEGLVPKLGPWLSSFTHAGIRATVETGIEDFRERWAGYLEVLQPYLENLKHHLGPHIPTFFERPKKA